LAASRADRLLPDLDRHYPDGSGRHTIAVDETAGPHSGLYEAVSLKVYCEDWACPAAVSCARHFGRSREYAGMRDRGYRLEKFAREPGVDSCDQYERDKPRPWLR
jgi:hypothetical protein